MTPNPLQSDGHPRSLRSLVRPPLNGSIVGRTDSAVDKVEAQKLLTEHLAPYRAKPYSDLASQVGAVIAFETKGPSGIDYNVEIMIMWDSPGEKANVRVMAAVDDQHWPAWFRPKSDSFIVAPDGSFVGE